MEPSELKNGKGLRVKACSGDDVQKWIISSSGQIVNKKDSNFCLSRRKARPNLQLGRCSSVKKALSTFAYDWFDSSIVLLSTKEVISIPLDDTLSQIFMYERDSQGSDDNQKWTLVKTDNSEVSSIPAKVTIRSGSDSKCLQPEKASLGKALKVESCTDKKLQKWNSDNYGQLHSQKDGTLCIKKSKKVLVLGECASASSRGTSFIYNYWDRTILWAGNPNKKAVTVMPQGTVKVRKKKLGMITQIWNFENA